MLRLFTWPVHHQSLYLVYALFTLTIGVTLSLPFEDGWKAVLWYSFQIEIKVSLVKTLTLMVSVNKALGTSHSSLNCRSTYFNCRSTYFNFRSTYFNCRSTYFNFRSTYFNFRSTYFNFRSKYFRCLVVFTPPCVSGDDWRYWYCLNQCRMMTDYNWWLIRFASMIIT